MLSKSEWPWHWPFKINEVKSNRTNGLSIHAFLLMFYSNTWLNCSFTRYKASKSEWPWLDLSRWLNMKCDNVIGLPIYAFLSMFNINIWPKSAPLHDIEHQNLNDLDFDLSRSLKVKCDVIGLAIHDFLFYCNHMSDSHHLALIATQNVFSYLLSLGEKRTCTKWPQNELECYKAKCTPYRWNCLPVPNFTLFCSLITRFRDNWSFLFLHRLDWWIWNFRKKNR